MEMETLQVEGNIETSYLLEQVSEKISVEKLIFQVLFFRSRCTVGLSGSYEWKICISKVKTYYMRCRHPRTASSIFVIMYANTTIGTYWAL